MTQTTTSNHPTVTFHHREQAALQAARDAYKVRRQYAEADAETDPDFQRESMHFLQLHTADKLAGTGAWDPKHDEVVSRGGR